MIMRGGEMNRKAFTQLEQFPKILMVKLNPMVSYSNSLVLCLDSAKPFRHRAFFAAASDSCGALVLLGWYGEVLENSALSFVPA